MTISRPGANDGQIAAEGTAAWLAYIAENPFLEPGISALTMPQTEEVATPLVTNPGPPYATTALEWEADFRLRILEAGGSGGGWFNPNAVRVAPIGGGNDDTTALRAAINSAVAGAQTRGDGFAEVILAPGIYQVKGSLVQGGTTFGNAQIPLPIVSGTTSQKVQLIIHCPGGAGDTLPMWTQTPGQKAGAVLYSTLTAQSYSGTYGAPSVLGGPTNEQGYGNSISFGGGYLFNNIHVVIDGISVVTTVANPTIAAFDFIGCAELSVGRCGAFVDQPIGTVNSTLPTNAWSFGLRPPAQGNNAVNNIYSWSCEGYYTSLIITEHTVVTSVRAVYCNAGLRVNSQGYAHGNFIAYACVESCLQYLQWDTYTHAIVYVLDIEHNHGTVFDGGNDINDAGNNARGYVGFEVTGQGEGEGTEPVVNGGINLKINNIGRRAATANIADGFPAIPTPSGTSMQNPFWKDAFIFLTGGTLTGAGVTVSTGGVGARTVALTTPCMFCLPSGAYVAINYSSVPTQWVWTLI